MKSLITTLLLITGISMAQGDMPTVPQTMSFQAVITDTLGVPRWYQNFHIPYGKTN